MTVTWKQTGDPMKREAWLGYDGDDTAPTWRITEKRGGQQGKGFIIEIRRHEISISLGGPPGRPVLRWQSPLLGAVAEVDGGSDEAMDMVEYFKNCGA